MPKTLRKLMLEILHETHLGINKTKSIAKNNLYWPAMLADIDNYISKCPTCLKFSRSKEKAPLQSHDIPGVPYYKTEANIAEYDGRSYLVVYDYYSRWLELKKLNDRDSHSIIKEFKEIFSYNGILKILIADNMPFKSVEMKKFTDFWNFDIIIFS